MMWRKQGCVFKLEPALWRSTHVQVPTPVILPEVVRVYYACRISGRSYPAFFDLDRRDLTKIVRVQEESIMTPGEPGMFDSDGVMPSCVIENNGELWMYYIGWSELKNTARYQNEIGLAVSRDGGETFERRFKGPIMGRSPVEPGLAVMPFVMYKNWNLIWYQSLTKWEKIGDQYEPIYVIKYAESVDGVKWIRLSEQCVASKSSLEAFSRPSVIYQNRLYRMWYCFRESEDYRGGKGSYRIGYAESRDGIEFERKDEEAGITIGTKGEFDSEMLCYPYIFELDGQLVMLYNGNGFGQSGVGLAFGEQA